MRDSELDKEFMRMMKEELGVEFIDCTPKPKVEVIIGNTLPCLHCGELIDMSVDDIHFCNKTKREWLDKQEEAIVVLPDGRLWDLKKKKVVEVKKDGD